MAEPKDAKAELAQREEEAQQYVCNASRSISLTECRLLETDSKIKEELEDLQNQVRMLRIRGAKLQRAKIKSQVVARSTVESFAKRDCQNFCEEICRVLPREIRDTIYGFIHGNNDIPISPQRRPWDHFERQNYFECNSEAQWRNGGAQSSTEDHLWMIEYIGKRMLPELIEYYYRSTRFHFLSRFEDIPRFQITDQWNIGVIPADFITNVTVAIECGHFDFDSIVPTDQLSCNRRKHGDACWCTDSLCDVHDTAPPPKTHRVALLSDLQTLFAFKAGSRMLLNILTTGANGGPIRSLDYARDVVIPIIFPTLQRLSRNGHVVKIAVSSGYTFAVTCVEIAIGGASTLETLGEEIHKVSSWTMQRR
jgi:hypothetical protein